VNHDRDDHAVITVSAAKILARRSLAANPDDRTFDSFTENLPEVEKSDSFGLRRSD
jgi:hypothetical protein